MARKDQLSSKKDQCDICGTVLDDEAVIQEFPDGSVVKLCADCATAAAPEDEPEPEDDLEFDDATVEWSDPDHAHPAGAPPVHFEPEVFDPDQFEPAPPAAAGAADYEDPEDAAAKAAAELAAWASAPAREDDTSEEDIDVEDDFDQEAAQDAAFELVAAIAEADMAEEEATGMVDAAAGFTAPEVEAETIAAEAEADEVAAETVSTDAEPVDKTKELLVPVTDLLALQTEMQSALARLSTTLEHFVSDMVATEEKTSAINGRLQQLEDELESTRERLRVTESFLPESAFQAVAAVAAATATFHTELVGTPRATPETAADEGSAAPGLPAEVSEPAAAAETKAPAPVPPPIGTGATGGAPVPPPLPGVPGAGPGSLVPPPIGAAAPTVGAGPPPLPFASVAKPVSAPPMARADTPATTPAPVTKQGIVAPPVPARRPAAPPRVSIPGGAAAAAGAAAIAAAAIPAVPAVPAPGLPQHPHSVAVAAAAMQKLLRGRKAYQQPLPEPEPEPESEPEDEPGLTFSISEVQVAQRYFNESEFVKKVSEISRSIGKPKANVSRTLPGAPEAAITVFWDIVWYQYLVDLRKDLPAGEERVVMDREGMDLEELEPRFTEKNSTINDDGRLDASELEVRLLSDPSALITEMEAPSPETRLADDATEEIWDQQSAPDFRWD